MRYQGASGDFNPIHHDEEYAKSAGFPTVFSVGMLQAGILATYATDWLGADNVRTLRVPVPRAGLARRHAHVPGDGHEALRGGRRAPVDLELACTRQDGGTAIKGWADVRRAVTSVRR